MPCFCDAVIDIAFAMMYNTEQAYDILLGRKKMQISMLTQINLIVVGLIGLVFCFVGYKFARFLLPVCGMIVIESILYLLVGDYLKESELSSALFYGGTAVASYFMLFFLLRLPAFITGAAGAGIMFFLVHIVFNLADKPFVIPVIITLAVLTGLISFVYRRVGVIIATGLFGAGLTGIAGVFLVFAPKADYAQGQSIADGMVSVIGRNGYIAIAAFAVLLLLGLLVQFGATAKSQFLEERLRIAFENREVKKKKVK